MELKAEIGERNERAARGPARSKTRRRLLAGVAAAGIAAAAMVAVPLVTGSESSAYALTRNPDGSLTLKINEFRDSDQVERDLAELGVKADVSYVKPGTWCAPDRGRMVGASSIDPADLRSKDPKVFGFVLIDGPVKPCTVVDDPSWNDIGDPVKNPEAFPPPGS